MEFFMPMKPPTVTDQEKRIGKTKTGKVYVYKDQALKDAQLKLLSGLSQFAREEPMIKTACSLHVKWCFPIPENGNHKNGEYKTTKPDTDNLNKLLKDCLTQCGFYKDDALVCLEIIEKFYADIPGVYIRLEVIDGA